MDYTTDTLLPSADVWPNGSFYYTASNTSFNGTALDASRPVLEKIINLSTAVIAVIIMISLGCTMELSKIKANVMKPKGLAIAAVAQFGVMPLTAFLLAKAFQLNPVEAVAVLVCGCCPGGLLSNILTLLLQGDMNLSIVMTSCSTMLALGMMPLLLYLYCQGFPNLVHAVPYLHIILALAMTIIPCTIGIAVNHYKPQYSKIISRLCLPITIVVTLVIIVLASFTIGKQIFTMLTPSIITIACLMPFIGFVFGYGISSIFRLSLPCRRTIAMETGCQNNNLAASILRLAFPQELIGPLFLFPGVYILFQLAESLVIVLFFRCHQRFFMKQKEKDKSQKIVAYAEVVMDPSSATA